MSTSEKPEPPEASIAGGRTPPECLIQTRLYQRLPLRKRMRLDADLVLRPPGRATLQAIAAKFRLRDKYGISLASLRTYADEFEKLARPVITSQLLAGALGCLPENYRREVASGGQVLLLSRVLAVLTAKANPPANKAPAKGQKDGAPPPVELSVADLARLATVLSNIARQSRSAAAGKKTKTESGVTPEPYNLAEAVRTLYGLTWPLPETGSKGQNHGESKQE